MKVTKIYKCIECEHQFTYKTKRLEDRYRSPCPKCGGKLKISIVEVRGGLPVFNEHEIIEKAERG